MTNRVPADNNSFWLWHNDSQTVLVFVHGILSDSLNCWTYVPSERTEEYVYWPDLARNDPRIGHPSIYMGGYSTFPGSGDFRIKDAARELLDSLRIPDVAGCPP